MTNRRNPAPPAATLDINCDCKEYVIDYLAKSFPVRLMQVFADEDGNLHSEAMSDEEGNPVFCPRVRAPRLSRRRAIVEMNRRSPRTSVVTGLNSGADA